MNASPWDRWLPIQNKPRYDGTGKRRVLTEVFGDTTLAHARRHVLVTAYDLVNRRATIFKSSAPGADRLSVVEVADASSAAPTYFPTVRLSSEPPRWLVDGGLAANNPSACAVAEALRLGYRPDEIRLLSVGTGIPTRGRDHGDRLGRRSQGWGPAGWMANDLLNHFFAAGATTVEYLCQQILDGNHVRVDGPLDIASDDLDEVSSENLNDLQRLGDDWYERHAPAVRELLRPVAPAPEHAIGAAA